MLRLLFSVDGLAMSPDETVFEDRHAAVLQYVRRYCPVVEEYMMSRIIHKLFANCSTLWEAPWLGPQRWTNNACESANNLVKLAIDWKPARLTDLVRQLHDLVRAKYVSTAVTYRTRRLCSSRQLCSAPSSFLLVAESYRGEKTELFLAFLADCGIRRKKEGIVTSSDGSLSVQGSYKMARKPGHRKRPRAERAGTHRKAYCY